MSSTSGGGFQVTTDWLLPIVMKQINQTNKPAQDKVKVFPPTKPGEKFRMQVIPTAQSSSFLQQSPARSVLSKPLTTPHSSSNKNSQTIVVANSSGVVRSLPATMVMVGNAPQKKPTTTLNSSSRMKQPDRLPFLPDAEVLEQVKNDFMNNYVKSKISQGDSRDIKEIENEFVTAFNKGRRCVQGGRDSPVQKQNVMLVTASNSSSVNQNPALCKASNPQNVVYALNNQGKPVQVVLSADGNVPSKPGISLVPSSSFAASPAVAKQDSVILNVIPKSPSPEMVQEVPLYSSSKMEGKGIKHQGKVYTEVIQNHGKYLVPIVSKNPVLLSNKSTKAEDATIRFQATSLGQIVSSNPSGSVTNFQISNGQIISENVMRPQMLPLLEDSDDQKPDLPLEEINQDQDEPVNEITDKIEDTNQDVTKDEVEIQEIAKEKELPDVDKKENDETPTAKISIPEVKKDTRVVKNRRKQALAVKDDSIAIRKSVDDEVSQYFSDKDDSKNSVESDKESITLMSDGEKENRQKEPEEPDGFDPIKYLEWNDNVGCLPLSDLKFKLNEFGLLEIVEDEEDSKISVKNSIESEKIDRRRKKYKNVRNLDEILCCLSCGTYGMGCEFVSSRFCSVACSKAYAEEKAQTAKKQLEKQEKKMKLKQQKVLLLQQRAKLEKLGLHEAKTAIEEKIKMLRMERELMKTNTGDSDNESGSSSDRVKASARNLFSWTKYLTMLKAKSAPYTLFKDPFPTTKNNFKVGMKLEGIDPVHPSLFCVLTVAAVRGYRIRLHFDGYSDVHDFWVNANSSDIFHAGWCERTNHKLSAPKGYGEKSFNWGNYLRMTRTVAAPKTCFVNNQERNILPSGFRAGMKLEAVDKKNSSLVCVATITDVLDNRILVHFDSWDDIYDYWVDNTSPYIHPVGWCKENGHQLTPPNDYKSPDSFSWDEYLRETKSLPAPARAFKPRTTTEFRRGMKLECVDKRNTTLIRVATVVDVVAQQIKIKFDGWPDQYAYWVDDDSPDIHPAGWCQKTGHPLEPPPSEEDIKNTSLCPTPGCRGIGHVKGKHPVHHMILSCPYSSMNYLRDDHIPDRFLSKREYYEVKETSLSKGTKPRPGISRKKLDRPISPPPKHETRGRKRRIEKESFKDKVYQPSSSKKKSKGVNKEEEIGDPGSEIEPPYWSKNNWDISETVNSVGSNPLSWTPSQVATFVENINNSAEKGKLFIEHHIDGEALLMLSQNDLVQILGFKLGPAIKLYKSIVLLRQKALEIKNKKSS